MLEAYGMVYVKPEFGMHGRGVMRVEQQESGNHRFKYQHGQHMERFDHFQELYQSLRNEMGEKPYLLQKGVHMLKQGANDFDIRVLVQKSPRGRWEVTGAIGRVAHASKIVTNVHNGGTLKRVSTLLSPYMSVSEQETFLERLRRIGLRVAAVMDATYPGVKDLGLDIAIDHQKRPWILEVNTSPDPFIFRKLQDKSVFHKVYRYWRYWR